MVYVRLPRIYTGGLRHAQLTRGGSCLSRKRRKKTCRLFCEATCYSSSPDRVDFRELFWQPDVESSVASWLSANSGTRTVSQFRVRRFWSCCEARPQIEWLWFFSWALLLVGIIVRRKVYHETEPLLREELLTSCDITRVLLHAKRNGNIYLPRWKKKSQENDRSTLFFFLVRVNDLCIHALRR